jgi:hypothetical protein
MHISQSTAFPYVLTLLNIRVTRRWLSIALRLTDVNNENNHSQGSVYSHIHL